MMINIVCPGCSSDKIVKAGFRIVRDGRKQRYRCNDCGRTFCFPSEEKKVGLD